MAVDKKVLELITSLNEKTLDGKIKWSVSNPPASIAKSAEGDISQYYSTTINGNNYSVFLGGFKHYFDEDNYEWREKSYFTIINEEGQILLKTYEYIPVLDHLFSRIQVNASNIDDLLNNINEL
ncbi:hypothetical protein [Oceanospirillum beijerinckii]|uniref:hypothetical protein n=1 Tax=Oceanospirillum beijerinckii TaxID=64976 RepID=UPI00055CA2FE|nr:hypothetical protein [Oceanospirillum beijerinckii]